MFDLTKYSEQELEALREAISKEQGRREPEGFPYKVGDCFVDISNDSYSICRIDSLNIRGIDITMICVDNNGNPSCFTTVYTYKGFIRDWNKRIDSKIFSVYIDINSTISALKQQFINKIKELCH